MTPGLSKIRLRIDITNIPKSLSNYLYILVKFLDQLGTSEFDYKEFS
jgi:hypothetical protein